MTTLSPCGPLPILPPALKRWGPKGGRYFVATLPTCGPPLISSPALKRWESPRRQGLCSHLAHLWPISDSAPSPEAGGTPQGSRGYVATLPSCGPLLIVPQGLKHRRPRKRQGLCSYLAPGSEAVGTPQAARVM